MGFFYSDLLDGLPEGRGLWRNEAGYNRSEWKKKLLNAIVGPTEDASLLRDLFISYYRGRDQEHLRCWSGVDQHLSQVDLVNHMETNTLIYIRSVQGKKSSQKGGPLSAALQVLLITVYLTS